VRYVKFIYTDSNILRVYPKQLTKATAEAQLIDNTAIISDMQIVFEQWGYASYSIASEARRSASILYHIHGDTASMRTLIAAVKYKVEAMKLNIF
jgi:hypothetical protein